MSYDEQIMDKDKYPSILSPQMEIIVFIILQIFFSSASPLNCGVPQGSIIGPLLFLIYVNDLPNCLNVGTPRMYADDTNVTFSAATIPDLESLINSDLKYIDRWLKAQVSMSLKQSLWLSARGRNYSP